MATVVGPSARGPREPARTAPPPEGEEKSRAAPFCAKVQASDPDQLLGANRDRIRIQRPDPETARELEQMTQAENHRPRDTRRYRACYYICEKWPLRYVIVAAAKRDRDL